MKVVHIGWYRADPVGGVGKTILEQTRALSRIGVDVEIWEMSAHCKEPMRLGVPEAYSVWRLPAEPSRLGQLFRFPKATKDWIEARRAEVSVLHLHSVFTAYNCLISRLGIPYVITPNGGWSEEVLRGRSAFLKRLWIWLFERKLWREAEAIQAVSRREAGQISAFTGVAPVVYIPNGTELARGEGGCRNRSTFLYIGRYGVMQKGLDVLIGAVAHVKDRLPGGFRLIMAGADYRDGRSTVEKMIRDSGLEGFIETRDPVYGDEKQALFEDAKLFIHTSRWEGLPLVLLEALAHGVPCLLTPGTNVAEEWERAGCGIAVGLSHGEIGEKLLALWGADLSVESENARKHAATEFNWDDIARRLLGIYEKCKPGGVKA